MKTRVLILLFTVIAFVGIANAQSLQVTPELKELINLSVNKDYKVASKTIDKEIAEVQQKAVRSAYLPKVEIGGKYMFAYSTLNSKIGDITGFESLTKLQGFMQNPAFPVMFPGIAQLAGEITKLQQLLAQQGMQLPALTKNIEGDLYGNYFGLDASAKMLLYSGGQVPNLAKALSEKAKSEDALSDKCETDVISDVISCYDQLALLNQSKKVLDESTIRLAAEKKYAIAALNNGMATSFDTLKIAVAEANLEAKLADYESKRTLLSQKLAQLTGKPISSFDLMNPDLPLILYTNASSDISNRAELRALNAGVEARKYMLKAEKSHSLPKVQAVATGRYDNLFKADANFSAPIPMEMKIDRLGLGPSVMVGVGFKWELFDRSGGSSKVKQANLEVKKAENAVQEARELLQLNQTKVLTSYDAAVSQVAYKDKQRQAAKMALGLAQKSYNEGMINITERLAVETEMQNAELEYLQALFAQRQSAIECYKATGNLTLSSIR